MGWLIPILAAAVLWPLAAVAEWQATTRDDGALFYGDVASEGRFLNLRCVGLSRGGRNPVELEVHEVGTTPIYGLRLEIETPVLAFVDENAQRTDVAIWIDGTGYQLPTVYWNILDGNWNTNLQLSDPLIAAMRGGRDLIFGPVAGPQYRFSTAGLGTALDAVTRYCVSEYQRLGHPVPAALSAYAASAQVGTSLEAAIGADIAKACPTGATTAPGHILSGQIDHDDQPDFVLDWGAVTCNAPPARPFCGASMCGADVYLSSRYPAQGQADVLLALGVRLIPLSNGFQGIELGGSLSTCNSAGKGSSGCVFVWYWSGTDLARLP